MVPKGGLEPPTGSSYVNDNKHIIKHNGTTLSPIASHASAPVRQQLTEIALAWPTLAAHIRQAILALAKL